MLLLRTQLPRREKASRVEGPHGSTWMLTPPSLWGILVQALDMGWRWFQHPAPWVIPSHECPPSWGPTLWSTDTPLLLFSAQTPDSESVSTINLNSSHCKYNCTCAPNGLKNNNSFSKKGWEQGCWQIPPNKHALKPNSSIAAYPFSHLAWNSHSQGSHLGWET